MGATLALPQFTLEDYLAFEEQSADKHEFWNGQIFAMAGASPVHNQICFTLAMMVGRQLSSQCRGYSSDQKIRIEAADLNTYADLTIVCGEPNYHAKHHALLLNPRVIFEVLSPATAAYDRGEKWSCYQQLPSLTDYLLVEQDRAQIEHYILLPDGGWRYVRAAGLESALTIGSLNCQLPLSEIYNGIEFPPLPPPRSTIQLINESWFSSEDKS
ncbi:MAG: Uma2 family endonuclease [Acidobacteria bacterium]|nr:Uma2 family endonuclease [Acidobacteriota bacterium]